MIDSIFRRHGHDSDWRSTHELQVSFSEKHPLILPRSHHVTTMLIRYEHISTYHVGVQSTLYSLRSRYWIIDGRNKVRKVIRDCMACARENPPSTSYIMGHLPEVRTYSRVAFNRNCVV